MEQPKNLTQILALSNWAAYENMFNTPFFIGVPFKNHFETHFPYT